MVCSPSKSRLWYCIVQIVGCTGQRDGLTRKRKCEYSHWRPSRRRRRCSLDLYISWRKDAPSSVPVPAPKWIQVFWMSTRNLHSHARWRRDSSESWKLNPDSWAWPIWPSHESSCATLFLFLRASAQQNPDRTCTKPSWTLARKPDTSEPNRRNKVQYLSHPYLQIRTRRTKYKIIIKLIIWMSRIRETNLLNLINL
jgi:hypothetical protein